MLVKVDLTNMRFGNLLVLSQAPSRTQPNGKKAVMWNVRCDCGKEKVILGDLLKNGHTQSCGCLRSKDLTGRIIGSLTVLKRTPNRILPSGVTQTVYLCKCVCGNELEVTRDYLICRKTPNCECAKYMEKSLSLRNKSIDAKAASRLRGVYSSMRNRCENPNSLSYKNYGGRGIEVCDGWRGKNGLENFRDWAYANGYNPNAKRGECTLDRIDNDKGYSPDNCRWAKKEIQANNKRTVKIFTVGKEQHTISQWADICGISRNLVADRLFKGWSIEEALFTPVSENYSRRHHNGFIK